MALVAAGTTSRFKHTLARYGRAAIPTDMKPQDWGVSYDELEPYYDKFEFLCGICGKAGNLRGQKIGRQRFRGTAAAATTRTRR